jgi:2-amino-4-hydroxy-6-hydroxymethyldihydropteridine diphosphokinase
VTPTQTRAYLSIGSNLGDRLANLAAAMRALAETAGIGSVHCSPVYETAPLGPGETIVATQPSHLNCAVMLETSLSALALLSETQRIERALGRGDHGRWESRVIDIDIVLFGEERIDTPELTVPHAGMLKRAFVLRPLVDLDADLSVAGVGRLEELLPALDWQRCELYADQLTLRARPRDPARPGLAPPAAPR